MAILTTAEAAAALGVGVRTVQRAKAAAGIGVRGAIDEADLAVLRGLVQQGPGNPATRTEAGQAGLLKRRIKARKRRTASRTRRHK